MSDLEAGQKLLDECRQLLSEMKSHADQSASQEKGRDVSHHILGAAASLLGICFAIFGLIGAFGHSQKTLVDDFALVSLILLMAACLFSYSAMRTRRRMAVYEAIADVLFVLALLSLGVLSVALYFGLIS